MTLLQKVIFVSYDRNYVRETARLIQIRSVYPKTFRGVLEKILVFLRSIR